MGESEPVAVANRKLLIISYVFPPVGGIMVQRVLSFARYLPQHGIDVHVLSCWNPATPVYDRSLLGLVPPSVKTFTAFTPEPPFYLRKKLWAAFGGGGAGSPAKPGARGAGPAWKSRIKSAIQDRLSPDAQVLWAPFAIRKAAAIVERHGIDTVMVTAPPFSLFLVGNELKRRFPKLRLVTDFRDEWLRFMLTDFEFMSGGETRRKAEAIERRTIESSDLVVAVTRASLAEIRSRYPAQPESKFAFVPNGYDPALFEGYKAVSPGGSQVIVTHNGTAYKTSSPAYYLDALDALPAAVRMRIQTRFIGRVAETETKLFEGRESEVKLYGFLPQAEGLRRVAETDYLLLTMTNDFSLPGKLFEYMASGKPVLALSPKGGEVDRLLDETGTGWCVPHDDPAAIGAMLLRAVDSARNPAALPRIDWEAVRRFERPRVAAELAARLHGLA